MIEKILCYTIAFILCDITIQCAKRFLVFLKKICNKMAFDETTPYLIIISIVCIMAWAIGFFIYNATSQIHFLLIISTVGILAALKNNS